MKPLLKYTPEQQRKIKNLTRQLRERARNPGLRIFTKFVDCTPTTAQYVERFCKLNHLTGASK